MEGKAGQEEIQGEAEKLKDLLNIQDEMSSNYWHIEKKSQL